jgi:hypothetical protein
LNATSSGVGTTLCFHGQVTIDSDSEIDGQNGSDGDDEEELRTLAYHRHQRQPRTVDSNDDPEGNVVAPSMEVLLLCKVVLVTW